MKGLIFLAILTSGIFAADDTFAKDFTHLINQPLINVQCINGYNLVTVQTVGSLVSYQLKGQDGLPSLCGKRQINAAIRMYDKVKELELKLLRLIK